MRELAGFQNDTFFRNSEKSNWVGNIHALMKGRECIPFTCNGYNFFIEFSSPFSVSEDFFFNDIKYQTKENGFFIPSLNHRVIYLWGSQNKSCLFDEFCNLPNSSDFLNLTEFKSTLASSMKLYHSYHLSSFQYFFEGYEGLFCLIKEVAEIINQSQTERFKIVMIDELASPFYGFQFNIPNSEA